MKKLSICHITSAHNSHDPRIFEKECVSLSQAGYTVYLVAPGESREEKGVQIVGLGAKPASRLVRMTQMAKRAYKTALALDCEVYHLHDPELLPYGLKLKRRGKKVIFDSHEFYGLQIREKRYIPNVLRKVIADVYTRYEAHACKAFDAVISACTLRGESYFAGTAKREVCIGNLPRLEDMAGLLRAAPVREREPLIIYAGALTVQRGIPNLVRAIAQTPGTLVLCGVFDGESCRRAALSEPRVRYLGMLPRAELYAAYTQCRIGASTLLNVGQYALLDTLPTKVYEYMAAGIPAVLSDTPYNRRMAEQYGFGLLVDPGDPEAIARAIRTLLEDEGMAADMGEKGRRAVEERFNWREEEKKLLALYAELAEPRNDEALR